jgi:methylenetetrahydrofolate dehydrogenase(NAD+)/5,10-methenyltetrahydrofolate cyclohydrolase
LKAHIIDGVKIAQDIRRELKVEIDEWIARGNKRPHLTALLVGEDPASATYVNNKMKAAREIGEID